MLHASPWDLNHSLLCFTSTRCLLLSYIVLKWFFFCMLGAGDDYLFVERYKRSCTISCRDELQHKVDIPVSNSFQSTSWLSQYFSNLVHGYYLDSVAFFLNRTQNHNGHITFIYLVPLGNKQTYRVASSHDHRSRDGRGQTLPQDGAKRTIWGGENDDAAADTGD